MTILTDSCCDKNRLSTPGVEMEQLLVKIALMQLDPGVPLAFQPYCT